MGTKLITLHFNVPETLDTPSETLAELKQLLIEGAEYAIANKALYDDEKALLQAVLVEG
jgi:hypothetical protein